LILSLLAVLLVGGALAYHDVRAARSLALGAVPEGRKAVARLMEGDATSARSMLLGVIGDLTEAERRLDRPWVLAAKVVPIAGSELRAAQGGIAAARETSQAVLVLVDFLLAERPPLLDRGTVSEEALDVLVEHLREALEHAQEARDAIEGSPSPRTRDVQGKLTEVDESSALLTEVLSGALPLAERLGEAAGGGDPYRILVIFENGAELRGTGGLPGLLALMEMRQGRVHLARADVTHELRAVDGNGERLPIEAPDAFLERYGPYLETDTPWLNLNMTPDFPTVARVTRSLYAGVTGVEPEAVARVDLVGLGYLLAAFPGLTVEGVPVQGEKLATEFLIDSYRRFPGPEEHNRYLATVIEEAFEQVLSGSGAEGDRLVAGLRRAVEERRLSVVTGDEHVDALLTRAGADGAMLPGEPGDVEVVLQNFNANKIDLFTKESLTVVLTTTGCLVEGELEVRLDNQAPPEAEAFPNASPGLEGVWWVSVYLPREAELASFQENGATGLGAFDHELDRPVISAIVRAQPGSSITLHVGWWEVVSSPEYRLRMQPQPMVRPADLSVGSQEVGPFSQTETFPTNLSCRTAEGGAP
jgi:hypothetical protein